jgi:hypothetical protein
LKTRKGIADIMITYTKGDIRLLGEGRFLMGMEVGNDTGQAGGHDGSKLTI